MANTSMIEADHAQIADWIKQFHRDGFLFLRNVLDEARTEPPARALGLFTGSCIRVVDHARKGYA